MGEDMSWFKMATGRGSKMAQLKQCWRTNVQSILMMVGVLTGIVVGVSIQLTGVRLSNQQLTYLKFPGELFLQMMKMVMIPVVVSSLLTATADVDVRTSGKISVRALVYYLVTLIMASCLGILLCVTIQPGRRTSEAGQPGDPSHTSGSPLYAFMDLIRNMFPDNLVEACFSSKAVVFHEEVIGINASDQAIAKDNGTLSGNITSVPNQTEVNPDIILSVKTVGGVNMIGLVVVSILTGCVISYRGEITKPVYDFFVAIRTIVFTVVSIFLWYAPIGIAFLIISTFAAMDDLVGNLQNLAIFTVTVLSGLFFHAFVVLPILYLAITRKNPYRFVSNVVPAILLAFGSDSSGIAMPVTIRCLEEKNNVDPRVTRLVASVGATINMDGGSLYFSMMAIFLAQLSGISMNVGQIVNVSVMAISVSIGMGCVSGSQIAYMIMMPAALHLPTDNVSMLFTVDWLLARCRTVTNVVGDCYGAGIVEALSKRELELTGPLSVEIEGIADDDIHSPLTDTEHKV